MLFTGWAALHMFMLVDDAFTRGKKRPLIQYIRPDWSTLINSTMETLEEISPVATGS